MTCLPGSLQAVIGGPEPPAAGGQGERAFPQPERACPHQRRGLGRFVCGKAADCGGKPLNLGENPIAQQR